MSIAQVMTGELGKIIKEDRSPREVIIHDANIGRSMIRISENETITMKQFVAKMRPEEKEDAALYLAREGYASRAIDGELRDQLEREKWRRRVEGCIWGFAIAAAVHFLAKVTKV